MLFDVAHIFRVRGAIQKEIPTEIRASLEHVLNLVRRTTIAATVNICASYHLTKHTKNKIRVFIQWTVETSRFGWSSASMFLSRLEIIRAWGENTRTAKWKLFVKQLVQLTKVVTACAFLSQSSSSTRAMKFNTNLTSL